jgi:hypothetical protein
VFSQARMALLATHIYLVVAFIVKYRKHIAVEPGSRQSERCITFTSGLNAWSLRKGLFYLGKDLLIQADGNAFFAPGKASALQDGDLLFFTEEASLEKFLGQPQYRFLPRYLDTRVFDKFEFSEWLISNNENPVPYQQTLSTSQNSFPIVIKARRSWKDGRKLPRGKVLKDLLDYQTFKCDLAAQGLDEVLFFFQGWIPNGLTNCYSVSGFFDTESSSRQILQVTQKIAEIRRGSSFGSTTAIKLVRDPARLIPRTESILNLLNYTGPFELEFVKDERQRFFVLEINPRFWLQHGIFREKFHNLPLRFYLDYSFSLCQKHIVLNQAGLVWINLSHLPLHLLGMGRGSLMLFAELLQFLVGKQKVMFEPSVRASCRYYINRLKKNVLR